MRPQKPQLTSDALKTENAQLQQTITELRTRMESFRAIVENTPDQVIKYDRDLRRIYVNPAVYRTYGLKEEELLGKTIGSVVADANLNLSNEELSRVNQQIARVFETGMPVEYELEWPLPQGKRYYSVRLFPELDHVGTVTSVIGIARDITEPKRAAVEITKQKEILQKIFDHIPVMISFFQADGRLILVNREWERWRGWSLEEILNGKVDILKDGYPDPEYRRQVIESAAKSSGGWIDIKTRVRDGRIKEGTWAIVDLSDGTLIGIGQDVTDRRRAEKALREANERLEMILDSMTDRFFAFDKEWRITAFNRGAAEQLMLLGKDPLTFVGKNLWEEFPSPPVEEAMRRAMRERVVTTHEHYYPQLGEWIENRIYPSPDGGVAVFQRYITERKRTEEEMRRSEAYLVEGQRLSHTGSWAWNVSNGEFFWSEEQFRIFGLDSDQTKPSSELVLTYVHPEDRMRVQDTFESAVRARTGFETDCRIIRPDGTARHIHILAHPVFNAEGELTEYVGTVIDTTVQRQSEEERTQLLRRIITAQEEERHRIACELHDEMGQYLSALMLGIKSLSSADDLPQAIQTRIIKLTELTKEFSQEVRHFTLELRPTVLDDLGLHAALTNYVEDWSKRNEIEVKLQSNATSDQRLPAGTETALYRLAQETLNNVLKHSRAQLVSIVLTYDRASVVMVIEDDGVGFDLEAALNAPIQTRGLGLTSMRERIESVGGKLEIESAPQRGTTVAVHVPVI